MTGGAQKQAGHCSEAPGGFFTNVTAYKENSTHAAFLGFLFSGCVRGTQELKIDSFTLIPIGLLCPQSAFASNVLLEAPTGW